MKFGGNTWVKATGVLTLTVAAGQSVAANTTIAITFDLTNVAVAQAALTPTVEGTIAAAGGSAIASSNMVVTGMNVDVTTTTAAAPTATTAAPTATTAAPTATTALSGASSEAAWSTMLTVFAIAVAAFYALNIVNGNGARDIAGWSPPTTEKTGVVCVPLMSSC